MTNSMELPAWRTSTRSSGGNCVEVQTHPRKVLLRDSKNRDGGLLSFEHGAFADFLAGIRQGEFDRP